MQEIVERFLEKGKLLTPEALEYLRGKDTGAVLNGDIVVTKSALEKKDEIKIIKNLAEKKPLLTAEDFAAFYKTKFEKLKDMLLAHTRMQPTSINKLDMSRQEMWIVGMVKEIKQTGRTVVEIEDFTGVARVVTDSAEGLDLDDVVAVRAIAAGKTLYAQEFAFPEVPLRKAATGHGKACFISDLHLNEAPRAEFEKFLAWFEKQPAEFLFVAGDIGDTRLFEELVSAYCTGKKIFAIPGEADSTEEYPQTPIKFSEKKIISLSNPAMVEVNGIKILIAHEITQAMLKKRYLGSQRQITYSSHLVLEDVPDIVHHGHSSDPKAVNYKSISIVNSGSLLAKFAPVVIDLSTREIYHESGWNKA